VQRRQPAQRARLEAAERGLVHNAGFLQGAPCTSGRVERLLLLLDSQNNAVGATEDGAPARLAALVDLGDHW
jgi:hypothetical protein